MNSILSLKRVAECVGILAGLLFATGSGIREGGGGGSKCIVDSLSDNQAMNEVFHQAASLVGGQNKLVNYICGQINKNTPCEAGLVEGLKNKLDSLIVFAKNATSDCRILDQNDSLDLTLCADVRTHQIGRHDKDVMNGLIFPSQLRLVRSDTVIESLVMPMQSAFGGIIMVGGQRWIVIESGSNSEFGSYSGFSARLFRLSKGIVSAHLPDDSELVLRKSPKADWKVLNGNIYQYVCAPRVNLSRTGIQFMTSYRKYVFRGDSIVVFKKDVVKLTESDGSFPSIKRFP